MSKLNYVFTRKNDIWEMTEEEYKLLCTKDQHALIRLADNSSIRAYKKKIKTENWMLMLSIHCFEGTPKTKELANKAATYLGLDIRNVGKHLKVYSITNSYEITLKLAKEKGYI